MRFSGVLGAGGGTVDALDVKADVTLAADPAGEPASRGILLTVRGEVNGIDAATFLRAADDAKNGCPLSNALSGVEITLDARLEEVGTAPVAHRMPR